MDVATTLVGTDNESQQAVELDNMVRAGLMDGHEHAIK